MDKTKTLWGEVKREEGETYEAVQETRTIRNATKDMLQKMETGNKRTNGEKERHRQLGKAYRQIRKCDQIERQWNTETEIVGGI